VNNAYDLYRRILRDHPKSRDARRGVMRVRDRLLTGTRRALDDRDVAEATSWLERALAAGADSKKVAELSRDIAHERRLHKARQGIFEEVLTLSDLKAVHRVNPKYPRTEEAEGWVDVEFTVNERGRVKDAVVKDQSIEGVFERSALTAVRRWKFEPVRENGRPIPVRVGFRFTFRDEG
jgi:protein TonB